MQAPVISLRDRGKSLSLLDDMREALSAREEAEARGQETKEDVSEEAKVFPL